MISNIDVTCERRIGRGIVTSRLRQQHLAYTEVRNNYFQQAGILKHSII